MNTEGLSQSQNKRIIMVDASALSKSSCTLRFYQDVIDGYTTTTNANQIEFGTAVHKFRNHFRATGDYPAGILRALKHYEETPNYIMWNKKYLTPEFLQMTCLQYAFKYKNDPLKIVKASIDGKEQPMLEMPFCFPLLITDHVEVLAAGTIDEIGYLPEDNLYAITDLKTSSVWKLEEYFKHYELATQMLFYRWAIREYAKFKPNSILSKINENCCVMIDGVFYKGGGQPVEYARSKQFMFNDETLDEFNGLLMDQITHLVELVENNTRPPREGMINGSCNTVHGLCKYFGACTEPSVDARMQHLANNFIQQFYNPLEFQQ